MAKSGTTKKRSGTLTVRPTERISEMVSEIRDAEGYESDTSVVFAGIRLLHAKTFPSYVQKRSTKGDGDDVPESDAGTDFCARLGGVVKTTDVGAKVCVFYNFNRGKALQQELPLTQLSETLVRNQYSPSKEIVQKIRAEGKAEYKLEELTY